MRRIASLVAAALVCLAGASAFADGAAAEGGAAGAAAAEGGGSGQPGYYRPRPRYYQQNPMYDVRGYIGFSGVGTGVISQSGGAEYLGKGGGGFSLWGGVRFGPVLALELNYTGSFHNPAFACDQFGDICASNYLVLDMVSVDAKLHIPTMTNFDPFFQGGLMLAWIGREGFTSDATGGGFDLGGGFDIWLNPWWTFGLRGLYRGIKMSDYGTYTGTNEFLSLFTGEVNIAIHF